MKPGARYARTCMAQGSQQWVVREVSYAWWYCFKWSLALARDNTCREEHSGLNSYWPKLEIAVDGDV